MVNDLVLYFVFHHCLEVYSVLQKTDTCTFVFSYISTITDSFVVVHYLLDFSYQFVEQKEDHLYLCWSWPSLNIRILRIYCTEKHVLLTYIWQKRYKSQGKCYRRASFAPKSLLLRLRVKRCLISGSCCLHTMHFFSKWCNVDIW